MPRAATEPKPEGDMSDEGTIIQGTTAGVKTMADDTLRITFDVEPRFAQLAFAMFGTRGTPVAIARITPEAAIRQAQRETIKGGPLAKLAGQFCEAEPFRRWLRLTYDPLPRTSEDAATIIRNTCGITSRAELDHISEAADIFHREFRLPYNAWLQEDNHQ